MPHYRVFILDENDRLIGTVDLDCADDEEAKARAEQIEGDCLDLWRQVPLFGPDHPTELQ